MVIYRVGACKGTDVKIPTSQNFKLADCDINVLGICIDNLQDSYNQVLKKITAVTNVWKQHKLTLVGKVTMLNSLVGSLLMYHMQILPLIDKNIVIQINKIIENFIWHGRKPKIRTLTLQLPKCCGGLGLFDPEKRDKALKITWIKRMSSADEASLFLMRYCCKPKLNNQEFWYLNFKKEDVMSVCSPHGFWRSVVEAWAEYNYHEVDDIETMLSQCIWFNSHIRINNTVFCIYSLAQIGITQMQDFINVQQSRLYTYEKFCEVSPVPVDYLQFHQLISAIPKKWKAMLHMKQIPEQNAVAPYDQLEDQEKISPYVYKHMVYNENILESLVQKWQKYDIDLGIKDIRNAFMVKKLTKSTSLISFNYRLLHRVIFLNDRLFHMALVPTQSCEFCCIEKETVLHLFVECEVTRQLWTAITEYLAINSILKPCLSPINIFTNKIVESPIHFANLLCLIAKKKIYQAKCMKTKPDINAIIYELKFIRNIEKNNINTNKALKKFNNKWEEQLTIK